MTVAKYPVEVSDEEGQVDAINYLLSGPAGLGQNFAGFSTYVPAYLRPTFRQPFVTPITKPGIPLYAYYPINNATGCDINGTPVLTSTQFAKFTFTTPFAVAPYEFGDKVNVKNVNPSFYNDTRYLVWSCTTTDVIIKTNNFYTWPPYVSGGELGTDRLNQLLSTDCNGRVTVSGGTDRVFVSGQLLADINYDATIANSEFDIIVTIDRYTGYIDNTPGNNDYFFGDPVTTVAERKFHYTVSSGGTINDLETIFTQFIDGPNIPFGYYWYLLEFTFVTQPNYVVPNTNCGVGKVIVTGTSVSQVNTYVGITPTNVTGTGVGFTCDIDIDTTDYITYNQCATITITNPGTGYQAGDILTIPGTSLGGISPDNDMTVIVQRSAYPGDATCGIVELGLRSLTAQVVKQ